MVKKKLSLVCECKSLPLKSDRAILGKECVCKSPSRKEREFSQVIIETK